jgi:hypothetical protein
MVRGTCPTNILIVSGSGSPSPAGVNLLVGPAGVTAQDRPAGVTVLARPAGANLLTKPARLGKRSWLISLISRLTEAHKTHLKTINLFFYKQFVVAFGVKVILRKVMSIDFKKIELLLGREEGMQVFFTLFAT